MPALNFTAMLDDAQAATGCRQEMRTRLRRRGSAEKAPELVPRTAPSTSHQTSGWLHLHQQHQLRPGWLRSQGSGISINGALRLPRSLRGPTQDPSFPSPSKTCSQDSRPMLDPSSMASVSPTAFTTSPTFGRAETNVRSSLTGVKKSMHFLGLRCQLVDFLNLLRTIGLWRQAGLPVGGHTPGKFTWSTNTSCRRRSCSSFRVLSAILWPSG